MKTAISVPDDTFRRAEAAAGKHGMNRSQFYAAAAERYARELEGSDLTAAIDDVLAQIGEDGSAADAVALGRRRLAAADDAW
ncbi:hypothetical protein [Mobilicoccus massiliensis]|uniref:hypothetical protein n=1 Tax=Mobilicoccus massiliensis TaxID=1522310 RepID=UPI00058CFADA|nr:hypothetical protein [Mobilicoccus massiliensis]